MPSLMPFLELGLASGLRSMAAISQVSRALPDNVEGKDEGRIVAVLSKPWARSLSMTMAVGEMVADKLPIVPDRTDPGPLIGRAVNGAIAGHVLATRENESGAVGAMLGAVGAIIGAHVGFRIRRALTQQAGLPDLPVALCEDAIAIGLARHALVNWNSEVAGDNAHPIASAEFAAQG